MPDEERAVHAESEETLRAADSTFLQCSEPQYVFHSAQNALGVNSFLNTNALSNNLNHFSQSDTLHFGQHLNQFSFETNRILKLNTSLFHSTLPNTVKLLNLNNSEIIDVPLIQLGNLVRGTGIQIGTIGPQISPVNKLIIIKKSSELLNPFLIPIRNLSTAPVIVSHPTLQYVNTSVPPPALF